MALSIGTAELMSLTAVSLDLTGLGYVVDALIVLVWLVAVCASRFDAGRRPRTFDRDNEAAIPAARSGIQTLRRDAGSRL